MKRRLLFIYNPNAGMRKIKDKLDDIINNLCGDDTELIVSPTRKQGDARERVIEYVHNPNCFMVACSGGDGTLHEVVSGMMQCENRVPIVYIPTGTTNDFGASLNIPKDMVEASDVARFGMKFPCDIAQLNDEYFVYTACFGLFTETSYATSQNMKNVLGHSAYVLKAATELTKIQRFNLRVEFDDRVEEGTFIFGTVCSTSSIGGVKGLTGNDVRFDDGLYELLLIRDGNILDVPALINDILQGNFSHKRVVYGRVKSVKFYCDSEVPWCVDGEFGGMYRDVEINIHKRAITLMIPRNNNFTSPFEDREE
ncbi:MAG: diacylglycerol kinase family lipid kinase [Lachnospiraceae bacterium]|nr:diacylglycerol kinase family lipid kinase [Lachnospiraceae bacterium]